MDGAGEAERLVWANIAEPLREYVYSIMLEEQTRLEVSRAVQRVQSMSTAHGMGEMVSDLGSNENPGFATGASIGPLMMQAMEAARETVHTTLCRAIDSAMLRLGGVDADDAEGVSSWSEIHASAKGAVLAAFYVREWKLTQEEREKELDRMATAMAVDRLVASLPKGIGPMSEVLCSSLLGIDVSANKARAASVRAAIEELEKIG